ncbi:hypothetical protein H4R99_007138, partial [Coemansia sp. RSA 1722]
LNANPSPAACSWPAVSTQSACSQPPPARALGCRLVAGASVCAPGPSLRMQCVCARAPGL